MAKTETKIDLKINKGTYEKIQENLNSIQDNELIITTDKNVPVPTQADAGKYFAVDVNGEYDIVNIESDEVDDTGQTNKFVTQAMYDWLDNQLYQVPTISKLLLYNNGSAIATTLETGSTVTFNQIRHQETNIDNISSLTFGGETITPSATETNASVTSTSVSATTTYTLNGVNTKNNAFSKSVTVTFNTYAYSSLTSSTTAPTSSLTRQAVDSSFRTNGADFNYSSGEYLYLYTTSTTATKIQTNVLGQWADVTTTNVGSLTITKSNGTTGTYKCFRTTSAFSASGTAKYRVV